MSTDFQLNKRNSFQLKSWEAPLVNYRVLLLLWQLRTTEYKEIFAPGFFSPILPLLPVGEFKTVRMPMSHIIFL